MTEDFTTWLQEQDRDWIAVREVLERFPDAIFTEAVQPPMRRDPTSPTLVHRQVWRRSYLGTVSRVVS
jgi:hypothetical protein